jgi:hypothetical protein
VLLRNPRAVFVHVPLCLPKNPPSWLPPSLSSVVLSATNQLVLSTTLVPSSRSTEQDRSGARYNLVGVAIWSASRLRLLLVNGVFIRYLPSIAAMTNNLVRLSAKVSVLI